MLRPPPPSKAFFPTKKKGAGAQSTLLNFFKKVVEKGGGAHSKPCIFFFLKVPRPHPHWNLRACVRENSAFFSCDTQKCSWHYFSRDFSRAIYWFQFSRALFRKLSRVNYRLHRHKRKRIFFIFLFFFHFYGYFLSRALFFWRSSRAVYWSHGNFLEKYHGHIKNCHGKKNTDR